MGSDDRVIGLLLLSARESDKAGQPVGGVEQGQAVFSRYSVQGTAGD
jgi:hypothetical protein